ncbi:MAG: Enoyl-CoA hydratase/isomerase [Alphaproteobacteria bacterium]|nr:Enoyl-CoA hydratase/isomerase [Alphaproteobacteria bacterium]
MSTGPLLYEKRGHIAYITFNRPEARNALTPEMFCKLADAWTDFAADDQMRVALVTGAGDKAFTAGADLRVTLPLITGARKPEDEWDHRFHREEHELTNWAMLKNRPLYKPIVAAVNGACIGAGSEMLQAIDIRIAGEGAFFAVNEVALGIMPGGGSAVRLARQVPFCKAMEVLLTGARFDAQEAYRMGFVNEVVPADQAVARAEHFAQLIAANSPMAVQKTKETVWRGVALSWEEAWKLEAENFAAVSNSEDAQEGARAFVEKRAPVFKGR